MFRRAAGGLALLVFSRTIALGCSSEASSTGPTNAGDPGAPNGEGTDGGGSEGSVSAVDPCAPGTVVPTQSASLDAWPVLEPSSTSSVATDTRTEAAVAPVGVVVGPGGTVFSTLGPAGAGKLGVFVREGNGLALKHDVDLPGSARPFGITIASSGSFIVVSEADQIVLVDRLKAEAGATDAVLGTVPTGVTGGAAVDVKLSKDDRFAFVALEREKAVAVLDLSTKAVIGNVPLAASAATGIVVSPDGKRLYVSAQAADAFLADNPKPAPDQIVGSITVVDAERARTEPAKAVLGKAFVGRAPVRLALSEDGSMLWVTLRGSNAIVALATEHLLSTTCTPVRAKVAVGPAPVGLAFFRNGAGLAVANSNRFDAPTKPQTISFVDVSGALAGSDVSIGQADVGAFPREVASDGDAVFVSNFNSSSLSTLDLSAVTFPHQ